MYMALNMVHDLIVVEDGCWLLPTRSVARWLLFVVHDGQWLHGRGWLMVVEGNIGLIVVVDCVWLVGMLVHYLCKYI